jgi:FlgD Ig-like domain
MRLDRFTSWRRAGGLAACALALAITAAPARPDPGVSVTVIDGVTRIELEGRYRRATYTVYRADARDGARTPVTALNTLCLGECFVVDFGAEPGKTYWYSFELVLEDGRPAAFGPFQVSPAAFGARQTGATLSPNPVRSSALLELYVAGRPGDAPVDAAATLHDLQGRRVATLYRGALPRGLTTVRWNGRDDRGVSLASGTYFLRFTSPLATHVTRVIRVR